jgi:2-oxoisovalerate dehydrogenase E1 component
MDRTQQLLIYRAMLTARRVDQVELEVTNRGEAFFTVAGSGHEAVAALAAHLIPEDWLHCHYRDKALLLARGISPRAFFDNLFSKDNSSSRGRQMPGFLSDPSRNVLCMATPVANNALQAVGVAAAIKEDLHAPLVYCGVGDGTTQEGEFLEACAEAVRSSLPVLFVVQNNRWAISTPTEGRTFYSLPSGPADQLFGMPIHFVDGRSVVATWTKFRDLVAEVRRSRGPAVVVLQLDRLTSHTNADDQSIYREREEIAESQRAGDPIPVFERWLLAHGWSQDELDQLRREVDEEVAAAEETAAQGPEPETVFHAKRPLTVELTHPSRERRGNGEGLQLIMRDALREVLRDHLRSDPRVMLFGEDIEDPKGDVFGVTRGLSTEFPERVLNSPLSESTIIGTCIGRALVGQRPVAFIQFADFLPLAHNQLSNELATLYWRSGGQWNSPVIVMVACGGYRPGLGPYHAQTLESVVVHMPGVDVFMPSTATDAAGLLNAAFESERPTVLFYPKSLLNNPDLTTSADVDRQFVPIGTSRKARAGRDITLVGWGNTVSLCLRAADALEKAGVEAEVLDLRCLSPWDEHAVLTSAEKTARLMVVHEDSQTCGFGGEVLAAVAQRTRLPVAMRRVTRPDTHIPCNFANQIQVMPSFERVMATCAELLNLELSWIAPKPVEEGIHYIEAIGSGPSDDTVVVVELMVQPGTFIERGQTLASLEATKSVFEITSPVSGVLEEVLVVAGNTVAVGAPLMRINTGRRSVRKRPVTQEQCGTPVLTRKAATGTLYLPHEYRERRPFDVGVSQVAVVTGSRLVTNAELLDHGFLQSPNGMSGDDIVRRTGISSRMWAGAGESPVKMAADACRSVLDQEGLILDDLDLVICSTTSPTSVTPSMACQVLNALCQGKHESVVQAFDINAACSGYLYALQAGYDYLQSTPNGRVLLVTAEVLSPLLDPADFDTAILFGDATSATVLYGEAHFDRARARLYRPELAAKGEDGSTLRVPLLHDGYIHMKGRKVFSEAVRSMVASLNRICERVGIRVDDLSLVVPHQANQRIIDAIQSRVNVRVFSNIERYGNTSSSSIPLCLNDVLPSCKKGDRLGLCAFGGGFTFGASILEMERPAAAAR